MFKQEFASSILGKTWWYVLSLENFQDNIFTTAKMSIRNNRPSLLLSGISFVCGKRWQTPTILKGVWIRVSVWTSQILFISRRCACVRSTLSNICLKTLTTRIWICNIREVTKCLVNVKRFSGIIFRDFEAWIYQTPRVTGKIWG